MIWPPVGLISGPDPDIGTESLNRGSGFPGMQVVGPAYNLQGLQGLFGVEAWLSQAKHI